MRRDERGGDRHRSAPNGRTGGVTDAEEAGGEVFFPRHRADVPGVGIDGRIFEDGAGCLRVRISENFSDEGATPTVLWPRTWSAERGKEGRVRFFDEEGRAVERTGEEVFLGGGFILPVENPLEEISSVDEPTKRELLRRCPGRYYVTGDIGPPFTSRGETTSS